jgi:flagellar biosynthesis protein FlhA
MKMDKSKKNRESRNLVIAMVMVVIVLIMVIPMPAIILNILMMVNLFLALAIFFTVIFTGRQLRTKNNEDKIISGGTGIFYLFPTIFFLCTIFGLTVYVNFTWLILTKLTVVDNKIILFFSGLISAGGTAGIITGFAGIIAICVAVAFVTKKGAIHVTEGTVRFSRDVIPKTMTAVEHTYTSGEISEEVFIARKNNIVQRANFLDAMDGAAKFIAGSATFMIFIMVAGIFGTVIIGTMLHGKMIQEAVETSIAFGISGGIIFLLPQLLLSVAMNIASSRVMSS